MSESFVKKPCKHCPFRKDVKPYLHPSRAQEIAYVSENPYSDFPCHKTFENEEDEDGNEIVDLEESKTCAGMLTMRSNLGERTPEGFEPSIELCYEDPQEMYNAADEQWHKNRKR